MIDRIKEVVQFREAVRAQQEFLAEEYDRRHDAQRPPLDPSRAAVLEVLLADVHSPKDAHLLSLLGHVPILSSRFPDVLRSPAVAAIDAIRQQALLALGGEGRKAMGPDNAIVAGLAVWGGNISGKARPSERSDKIGETRQIRGFLEAVGKLEDSVPVLTDASDLFDLVDLSPFGFPGGAYDRRLQSRSIDSSQGVEALAAGLRAFAAKAAAEVGAAGAHRVLSFVGEFSPASERTPQEKRIAKQLPGRGEHSP